MWHALTDASCVPTTLPSKAHSAALLPLSHLQASESPSAVHAFALLEGAGDGGGGDVAGAF